MTLWKKYQFLHSVPWTLHYFYLVPVSLIPSVFLSDWGECWRWHCYIRIRGLDHSYLPSITHTVTSHIVPPFQANKSICWLLSFPQAGHSSSLPRHHYCQHLADNDSNLQYLPWKLITSDVIAPSYIYIYIYTYIIYCFLKTPNCRGLTHGEWFSDVNSWQALQQLLTWAHDLCEVTVIASVFRTYRTL